MARSLPRGTVTFLFTGVADSTRVWEAGSTDLAQALRVHDDIVRGAIERHGGYVFGSGGDGFGAAFPTATAATSAALEAQEQLRDETIVTFSVRMGVHTGEAVERDRTYFGNDVTSAARLMSLAHGGQVLVSDATEVLLRDRVSLRLLGEHRLRGSRGRMSVYQLIADSLPTEFPALRRIDDFDGNLPQPLDSLVGRDAEVAALAEALRSSRLVTLTGVGGVGKTRLALEAGADVAGEFPDGVWMVELAPVGESASVAAAVATTLGVTPQGDATLLDAVAEALGGRRLLLVMDNCEHVLGAATSTVAAILEQTRGVRILATSREALALDGETVVVLAPLSRTGGVTSDAVTLFVDRARAVRPDFGLGDAETAAAVTEVCETVDGLPLGIELAAARMAAMNAIEVRDHLADRFRLLQSSTSEPERQHTLRNAVEWSYDLLDEDERSLLRETSVFAGGFDLTALCAVVEGTDTVEVLKLLDSLVRKSLVVADHAAEHTRYGLFETIRQFAEDRLDETGSREATRDRHAVHFAETAADRWTRWDGPGWRTSVDWVIAELGNLRSACQWAAARGDIEVASDIAAHAALMGFSVQLFETLAWAEDLIEPAAAADVRRLPRLCTAAGYACFAGRAEAARVNAHRAAELEADARYDACEPGYASFVEALGSVYCGDLERYIELTGEVARRYGPERGYALAAYVDGLQSAGRTEEALALAEDAVATAQALGNPYWVAYALWIAGMAFSKSEPRRAFAAWDEGVAVVREHRVQFFEGFLARDAARLHTSDGEPEAALALFDDAIEAFHRAGNVPQLVITLASVPALFERLERPAPAAMLLGALSNEPSSFLHVPELGELSDRLAHALGTSYAAELSTAGAALDLGSAAVYARQQIDLARRDPIPQLRPARPGGLSRREVEVLRLVADGRTAPEIATQLFISPRTAEHHIQNIYTKIGVSSRAAATRWAVTYQVVDA